MYVMFTGVLSFWIPKFLGVNMMVKKDKLFGIQRSTREDYYELHAELSLIKKYLAMSLTVHFRGINYEWLSTE